MPKTPKPEPKSDELEKKPYEPTQCEVEAVQAYAAAREKEGLALR